MLGENYEIQRNSDPFAVAKTNPTQNQFDIARLIIKRASYEI